MERKERRQEPRDILAPGAECRLTLLPPGGQSWAARVRDRSPHGAGVIVAHPLPLGTLVELEFRGGDRLYGEVVHRSEGGEGHLVGIAVEHWVRRCGTAGASG